MNEISKKKQNSDSSTEKTYYNINSFRELKMDKTKQANEIKIKNNINLTSRFFEMNKYNNKDNNNDKLRTTCKNKIISNKMQDNNITMDKNKTNK
jgi:hypothetical protein